MSKTCLLRSCKATCQDSQIFCRDHWFQVPKPIRDAIWDAHRRKDRIGSLHNIQSALRFFRDRDPKEPTQ